MDIDIELGRFHSHFKARSRFMTFSIFGQLFRNFSTFFRKRIKFMTQTRCGEHFGMNKCGENQEKLNLFL